MPFHHLLCIHTIFFYCVISISKPRHTFDIFHNKYPPPSPTTVLHTHCGHVTVGKPTYCTVLCDTIVFPFFFSLAVSTAVWY